MNNDLIAITPTTALQVLSSKDDTEKLIEDIRLKVMSLEGGKMDTVSGRKQIRSNAFKATKSKSAVKKMTTDLIEAQELIIAPQLATIKALKENYNGFAKSMDQIRKEVNAEVDEYEAELKRVEDEKAMLLLIEEAIEMNIEFNRQLDIKKQIAHMEAIIDNNEFDEQKRIEKENARLLAKQQEMQRIAHEEKIKLKAYEDARIEVERKNKAVAEKAELEKRRAIEARVVAEKAAKQAAIDAENERIKAIEQARVNAEKAEKRRLADIEAAKQSEINKQKEEKQRLKKEANEREADINHRKAINNAALTAIIEVGDVSNEQAMVILKAIIRDQIPNVSLAY